MSNGSGGVPGAVKSGNAVVLPQLFEFYADHVLLLLFAPPHRLSRDYDPYAFCWADIDRGR
jgi:hypothetical protein